MTLPLRWRIAGAVTSLLAVATLASPAGGAIVAVATLDDQPNDVVIQSTGAPYELPAADMASSTARYKPSEVTFTLVTASPEDPRITPRWGNAATGISWLIRTTSPAPAHDYELRYTAPGGVITGKVYRASDTTRSNPLCSASMASYSGKVYRAGIDPACIDKPLNLSFATAMTYQIDPLIPDSVVADSPDSATWSAPVERPKLGYWMVGRDGGIFSYGDAAFSGSTGDIKLNQPIVGMAADPDGKGYWFVAADGGVFAFDAPFFGSTGGMKLNKPIVGMAAARNGRGYWLVASDGGIFSFGKGAGFFGSTGDIKLNQPIVGMAALPNNKGYYFVAADGGIFAFGAAPGIEKPKLGGAPVTAIAVAPDGKGVWVARANGEVNGYGTVPSLGSLTVAPASPIVGIATLSVPDEDPAE